MEHKKEEEQKIVAMFWCWLATFKAKKANRDVNENELWIDTIEGDFIDSLSWFLTGILTTEDVFVISKISPYEVNLSKNNTLCIYGIAILGIKDLYEYTNPFYFEIELGQVKDKFIKYTFLLGDQEKPSRPWRNGDDFATYRYWSPCARHWQHEVHKKAKQN